MELFLIELGLSHQPFSLSYSLYGHLVTDCWLKTIWEKTDKFNIKLTVGNISFPFPKRNDKWLLAELLRVGYSGDELGRLNRVRLHMQVTFLSDVLCAKGKSLDRKYLSRRGDGEQWSTLPFPAEKPPEKDMKLWREALFKIAPGGSVADRLGGLISEGRKIWEWRYVSATNELFYLHSNGMDVYVRSRRRQYRNLANRYEKSHTSEIQTEEGEICTVHEPAPGVMSIVSCSPPAPQQPAPSTFFDVLVEWGCTWMWENLQSVGEDDWMEAAIADGSLLAVTDGSYIKELYPDLCSAAYIIECTKGRGRIVGSFAERTDTANAYRGELLGLMAVHLLLLSVNRVNPTLTGEAHIISDCLGALRRVKDLPPYRIPSKCRHSDILKNIMVHCSDLSFSRFFSHVRAHQSDRMDFYSLPREAQLNEGCDAKAKRELRELDPTRLPPQKSFPLEPLSVFLGGEKMTSDTGDWVRFWAHRQLARDYMHEKKLMFRDAFDEVAWREVYLTLRELPRLFSLWASKQVMDVAGTNSNLAKYKKGHTNRCPSCEKHRETCAHILTCSEEGRVSVLMSSIRNLEKWLDHVGTDPQLVDCIVEYARGRGSKSMQDVCARHHRRFKPMARSQDKIGWRRFLEGMISKEIIALQSAFATTHGMRISLARWTTGLITKLLEVTHGQWIYRNLLVHDRISGFLVTAKKEELQKEIQRQQDLGEDGLDEQDKFLLEIKLNDLEESSGEYQEYWLLAIRAARQVVRIRRRQLRATSDVCEPAARDG